ncbi:hypothetical protein ACWCWD_28980 [Streptomyces sp. NPDC001493]
MSMVQSVRTTLYRTGEKAERRVDLALDADAVWDREWAVLRHDATGLWTTVGQGMEHDQANALYEETVRAGAVLDGQPRWTHSDVPGIPLARYGYQVEVRVGEGWQLEHVERLVWGGPGPHKLDLEDTPRTLDDIAEAAFSQVMQARTLAGRERWLSAAAQSFGDSRLDWTRPGAGRHLVPAAVRVTLWGSTSDGETKSVIERRLPPLAPPTVQEIEEYEASTVHADAIDPHVPLPRLRFPVRTDDALDDIGAHFYFPPFRRADPENSGETLPDEVLFYDGDHPVARVSITATSAESLARAQHAVAAELAPWVTSILLLARADRLRTREAVEIDSDARLRDDPEMPGTWPCPHSEEEIARARAVMAEAQAAVELAVASLPGASEAPLPPLTRAWRTWDVPRNRWRDKLYELLRNRWAGAGGAGRDHLIRWTDQAQRHDLHYKGHIPMRVITRVLAQESQQ